MTEGPLVVVYARPPHPGSVKTRLVSVGYTATDAAAFYAASLADTLSTVAQAGIACELEVAGDPNDPLLVAVPGAAEVVRSRQVEGDLGARLSATITRHVRDRGAVVVLGSDAPTLPPQLVREGIAMLDGHDVVLGPTPDGGYYLLGARVPLGSALGAVRWSSPTTLADTLLGVRSVGRSAGLLTPWYDIDTPDDLRLLRAHLGCAPSAAPATARALGLLGDTFDHTVALR